MRRIGVTAALAGVVVIAAACGPSDTESVHLVTAATQPVATPPSVAAPEPGATPAARGSTTPTPTPTSEAGEGGTDPSPAPTSRQAAAPSLRTQHPTEGFDLTPPDGFHPVEYHPDHGRLLRTGDRQGGVRFYHRHGTTQSVVVSAWSQGAAEADGQLARYETHTGDVRRGRPVDGASDVWELRDRVPPDVPTRTSLFVRLADNTLIWLSGTDIEGVELLYDFLTRIEDAPGSMVPKPGPGEAVPGGVTD